MSNTIQQLIDTRIREAVAALRDDRENLLVSLPRIAAALAGGVEATLQDPGLSAYFRLCDIPVAENDYDGRASILRKAKSEWELAVLFPARVLQLRAKA